MTATWLLGAAHTTRCTDRSGADQDTRSRLRTGARPAAGPKSTRYGPSLQSVQTAAGSGVLGSCVRCGVARAEAGLRKVGSQAPDMSWGCGPVRGTARLLRASQGHPRFKCGHAETSLGRHNAFSRGTPQSIPLCWSTCMHACVQRSARCARTHPALTASRVGHATAGAACAARNSPGRPCAVARAGVLAESEPFAVRRGSTDRLGAGPTWHCHPPPCVC